MPKNAQADAHIKKIARRLHHVDIPVMVAELLEAIEDAKGMTGTLPGEEADEARDQLDQLRAVVVFVFDVSEPPL